MGARCWDRDIVVTELFSQVNSTDIQNVFAFSGEAKSKKYAVEIIHDCNEAWKRLVTGEAAAKTDSYDLSM